MDIYNLIYTDWKKIGDDFDKYKEYQKVVNKYFHFKRKSEEFKEKIDRLRFNIESLKHHDQAQEAEYMNNLSQLTLSQRLKNLHILVEFLRNANQLQEKQLDEYKEIGTVDEFRVAVDKLALLKACDEIEEENK